AAVPRGGRTAERSARAGALPRRRHPGDRAGAGGVQDREARATVERALPRRRLRRAADDVARSAGRRQPPRARGALPRPRDGAEASLNPWDMVCAIAKRLTPVDAALDAKKPWQMWCPIAPGGRASDSRRQERRDV